MTGQQLKNSILQMAVQGKLVPQDPNDEPASVLVEKIRAEKEKLIKEGKIKKDKNPSYIFRGADNLPYEKVGNNEPVCIADEVPFDIPDSWEWCRLSSLLQINPRNSAEDNLDAGFMSMPLLMGGFNNEHSFEIKKWGKIKKGFSHFMNNDVVVAKITPCFQNRKSAVIKNLPNGIGSGSTELHVLRDNTTLINMDYVLLLCKTPDFISNGVKNFTGTAGQQRIGKDFISEYLVPVPPIKEQTRIVNQTEKLLIKADKYSQLGNQLTTLQSNFPEQLKKSILQQAVMGKLVPQDENDEPANVLLEKIKAEKQRLIAEGKIKKDKHESVIFRRDNSHYEKLDGIERCIDDEIPFEIPDNWCWVRLNSICTKLVDGDHNPPKGVNYVTPFVMASSTNINNDSLVELDKVRYLTESVFEKENERTMATAGDILFTSVGSLGRSCIYSGNMHICFQRSVTIIATLIFNYYLKRFFDSYYFQQKVITESTGTAQKGFYLKQLSKSLIPIPPINEQHRIVEKIDELLSVIDTLK